jgi:hypothetical protein
MDRRLRASGAGVDVGRGVSVDGADRVVWLELSWANMREGESTRMNMRANEGAFRILSIVFAFAPGIPLREAFTLIERKTAVFLRTQRRENNDLFNSS